MEKSVEINNILNLLKEKVNELEEILGDSKKNEEKRKEARGRDGRWNSTDSDNETESTKSIGESVVLSESVGKVEIMPNAKIDTMEMEIEEKDQEYVKSAFLDRNRNRKRKAPTPPSLNRAEFYLQKNGTSHTFPIKTSTSRASSQPITLNSAKAKIGFGPYLQHYEDLSLKVSDEGNIVIMDKGITLYCLFARHFEDRKMEKAKLEELSVERIRFVDIILKFENEIFYTIPNKFLK
uniref:Uncharacterized protein n=1 Tax=Acrobeloides nanus TaxID=290746 RepID=A0A914DFX1_9BILA